MRKNVSVIVPVYNEERTIGKLIPKVLRLDFVREIIVVDDGSQDETGRILAELGRRDDRLRIITKAANEGKTAAIKTALAQVQAEIVIIQDADLEYDPDEIEYVCAPIWEDRADVVYGSRFLVRRASRVLYFYHYLANKSITFALNLFTNKNMTDVETCYKAFRSPLLVDMPISSRGFGFEIEVTSKVAKTDARIYETPISYYGRTYEEGKKIGMKDGLLAVWYIIKYNVFGSPDLRRYRDSSNRHLRMWRDMSDGEASFVSRGPDERTIAGAPVAAHEAKSIDRRGS